MTLDFIIYNTTQDKLSLLESLIPLVAAGFGAFAGGWLNQRNIQKNELKKNLQYLNYANSVLFGQLNSLYSTKQQFIQPEEVQKEIEQMKLVDLQPFSKELPVSNTQLKERLSKFKNCFNTIIVADYIFPIKEESLQFIATINPNIFTLITNCKETIIALNMCIKEINILI